MIAKYVAVLATLSAPVFAGPVYRLVSELDQDSFEQAQQRDDTATRALTNTTIQTSDGKCLFVDNLSGDSAANLTPIQVAACGATEGQGFDIITQGKHNDVAGSILIVSTLTQACFTFDPTQATGKQVILFSCGGVADGSGTVTTSQLFAGDGSAGSYALAPENQATSCFTVKGNSVEIADCDASDESQTFTFGIVVSESDDESDAPASSSVAASSTDLPATSVPATDAPAPSATTTAEQLATATCDAVTVTESVTVTVTTSVNTEAVETPSSTDTTTTTTLFVTVGPASSTDEYVVTSSTTTVFITVPNPTAPVSSSAAVATSSAGPASSKVPSDPNTIPQISINPTTTATAGSSGPVATTASATSEVGSSAAISTPAPSSSKAAANPNTIPQISISPHTTIVVS